MYVYRIVDPKDDSITFGRALARGDHIWPAKRNVKLAISSAMGNYNFDIQARRHGYKCLVAYELVEKYRVPLIEYIHNKRNGKKWDFD